MHTRTCIHASFSATSVVLAWPSLFTFLSSFFFHFTSMLPFIDVNNIILSLI